MGSLSGAPLQGRAPCTHTLQYLQGSGSEASWRKLLHPRVVVSGLRLEARLGTRAALCSLHLAACPLPPREHLQVRAPLPGPLGCSPTPTTEAGRLSGWKGRSPPWVLGRNCGGQGGQSGEAPADTRLACPERTAPGHGPAAPVLGSSGGCSEWGGGPGSTWGGRGPPKSEYLNLAPRLAGDWAGPPL